MDKFLGQEIPEENRKSFLNDNCDSVETIGYTRHFSPDELNQKREELAEVSIKIAEIEEAKKEAMSSFKEQLKPFEENKKTLLNELKHKSEYVNDECFKFIDHEERMVGYYDKYGVLVSSRPIMPQEMQKTVFSINRKTGTDN